MKVTKLYRVTGRLRSTDVATNATVLASSRRDASIAGATILRRQLSLASSITLNIAVTELHPPVGTVIGVSR